MRLRDRLMVERCVSRPPARGTWGKVFGLALGLMLAACAHKLPPPPPPPPLPPPPVEVIPPVPTPPDGAAPNMITPPVDAQGQRESVNRKVSVNQIVWNLRSAYTVAALDCQDATQSAAILPLYRAFLTRNAKVLKSVYDHMDHEFRDRYGRGGETLRDDYLTVLYNHYALPPTKNDFCEVVSQVIQQGADVAPDDLGAFAQEKVPLIEKVFDDFYTRYDQYKNALAEWDEKYGHLGRVRVEPLAQQPPVPHMPDMGPPANP